MKQASSHQIRDFLLLEFYYLYALLQALLGKNGKDKSLSDLTTASGLFEDNDTKQKQERLSADTDGNQKEIERIRVLRRNISGKAAHNLPLIRLRKILNYGEIEHMWLVLALAPQIDSRFDELYRSIDREYSQHPLEPGFAAMLLGYEWPERLDAISRSGPDNLLREFDVLCYDAGLRRMWVDERVLHFALGHTFEPAMLSAVRPRASQLPAESLTAWFRPLKDLIGGLDANDGVFIHIPDPVAGCIITQAATAAGRTTESADFARLLASEDPRSSVDAWLRESLLRYSLPVLEITCEQDQLQSAAAQQLLDYLTDRLMLWPQNFIIYSTQLTLPPVLEALHAQVCELPAFDARARQAIWMEILADVMSASATSVITHSKALKQISVDYDFDLAISVRIAHKAKLRLQQNPESSLAEVMLVECRVEARRMMSNLGQFNITRFSFSDIVLPVTTKSQLEELCSMALLQDKVRQQWGFATKLITYPSITALFAGPSGTGKTMAAEIIAGHLGRPLLRVDLAAVVSKYIGETEKNLEKIFRQAEVSCSLLFFDEADALFGKRSEVKEAHDRYANIEISYLLQRMEQYRGMAILASNLRQHLDDAFVRRLTMTVLFPFPSWEQRAQIWQQSIPEQTPLDKSIDWEDIARRYNLSGGNIRNAVVSAAYQAAMNDSVIDQGCIMHGIRREIQKMGKQMIAESAP